MSDPNWAAVLRAAYESKGGTVQWVEAVDEDHKQRTREWPFDLREVTQLSDEELEGAITFAERADLLSQVGSGVHYELTQKGFDIAHDRELRDQQQKHDRVISAFTVVLGASAIIQARVALNNLPEKLSLFASLFLVFIAATMLLVLRGHVEFLTGSN